MSGKFKTAGGYSRDLANDCEIVLVLFLQACATLAPTVRLVGGLVPRYLAPEAPPDVPAHVGTTDLDVVLNVSLLASKGAYAQLRQQLKDGGFTPYETPSGAKSSWQWVYELNGHQVCIELLQDTDDPAQSGKLKVLDDERISAMQFLHAGFAHEWYGECEVTVDLPGGNGMTTETIRFADAVAFIVLKTLAFDQSHEPKDVADLVHVLRHWGNMDGLVALFAQRHRDSAHGAALEDVLQRLARRFCDDANVEGWRKDGPSKFTTFHQIGEPGSEDFVRSQRDVSGLVTSFIAKVRDWPSRANSGGTHS